MASKQPRRSDLTSDLKFMAQTTYATMLFGLFWPLLDHFDRKKKERKKKNPLTSTRPVGFAAGKNDCHLSEAHSLKKVEFNFHFKCHLRKTDKEK